MCVCIYICVDDICMTSYRVFKSDNALPLLDIEQNRTTHH